MAAAVAVCGRHSSGEVSLAIWEAAVDAGVAEATGVAVDLVALEAAGEAAAVSAAVLAVAEVSVAVAQAEAGSNVRYASVLS